MSDALCLISYWPMARISPSELDKVRFSGSANNIGAIADDSAAMVDKVSQLPPVPPVQAVGWLAANEIALIIPNARAVAEHLQEWCENLPAEWFKLQIARQGEAYAMSLTPQVEKSLARSKKLLGLGDDVHCSVIFASLSIASQYCSMPNLLNDIPSKVKVYFVDPIDVKRLSGTETHSSPTDMTYIGIIDVVREGDMAKKVLQDAVQANWK